MSRPNQLYDLLPVIYRQRDQAIGAPLQALMEVLQAQYTLLESDIAALYDDWFAETCEPWLLAYIGELVEAGRLGHALHPDIDSRALVADTVASRRRKGLAATLERVVERATGWAAHVVEDRQGLAMTQHMMRPRPGQGGTVSMRDGATLARLGGAFDTVARRPGGSSGLRGVTLYLWRLRSYPMLRVEAGMTSPAHPDRRSVDPAGRDLPLFTRPSGHADLDHGRDEDDYPLPLSRRRLSGRSAAPPPFALYWDTPGNSQVAAEAWVVADLGDWQAPPTPGGARFAIDPERGRLLLLRREDWSRPVWSDHCWGRAADLGGGPYPRPAVTPASLVIDTNQPDAGTTLAQAIADWHAQGADGVIELAGNGTLHPPRSGHGWTIEPAGRHLVIRAADGYRPCLLGGLTLGAGLGDGGVTLDGLLIGGSLHLAGGMALRVEHCTLASKPSRGSIIAATGATDPLSVTIAFSILGAIHLPHRAATLHIADSIVDGRNRPAVTGVNAAAPVVTVLRSTLLGAVAVRELHASDTLFDGALLVLATHRGHVRHCLLPEHARAPRRFQCVTAAADTRLFTSRSPSHPAYGQLARDCPPAIRTGGSEGGEIGAFHSTGTALRLTNLHEAVAEYLPDGLQPTIIFAS